MRAELLLIPAYGVEVGIVEAVSLRQGYVGERGCVQCIRCFIGGGNTGTRQGAASVRL